MLWWLWLVPLAALTCAVWVEVVWGAWQRRTRQQVQDWRQHLDEQSALPPCLLCQSPTHTWEEHVRIPQAELAAREDDETRQLEGEW